jgi:ABC-type uncharacterized transport system substrate-binding protein
MSRNSGRWFGEGMAQDPRIQRLTDDLAVLVLVRRENHAIEGVTANRSEVTAVRMLGIELVPVGVDQTDDLEAAFTTMARESPDAITVQTEVLLLDRKRRILEFMAKRRVPAIYDYREFVPDGGLMFYGPSRTDVFHRAVVYVHRILQGEKPSNLPIEQPSRFDFVFNLRTVKTLGLEVPPMLAPRGRGHRVKRRELITLLGRAAAAM